MGGVDEILEPYKDKMSSSQFETQRTMLIKQRLINCIETKIIYLDAKQNFPAEHFSDVEKQLDKFYESTALPGLYKCCDVKSTRELDQKLRARGLSLEGAKKSFKEWVLAQECVSRQIKRDEEITYDQMYNYYQEHLADFETHAQAKWEELMVQFSKFHSKPEAYDAICQLGNQVFGGASFAEVAKNGSQGLTAANGGAYGWTTKGSLRYAEIDEALFCLPVNATQPGHRNRKGISHCPRDRAGRCGNNSIPHGPGGHQGKNRPAAHQQAIAGLPRAAWKAKYRSGPYMTATVKTFAFPSG